VAYVLEDGVDSHAWLDAIFASCFGRHGGRQSLVVPAIQGQISERYKNWLRLLDPDYVLLLTYNNAALVEPLARLLGDTTIQQRERVRDTVEQYPRVGVGNSGLSAISWLPFFKVVPGLTRTTPGFIVDRFPMWVDDGIIKDNFGTLYGSLDRFPIHDEIGVPALILTPADAPADRWHFRSVNGEEVQDAYSLIERLASTGNIATLAQLSNLASQRFHTRHAWNDAFCLVIGDTLADRISCWNAALLFDDAQTQVLKTMRVPAHVANDSDKLAKITHYLNHKNWINQQGGNGRVVVRSHSLPADQLNAIAQQLRQGAHTWIEASPIAAIDDCCPEDATQVRAGRSRWPNDPRDSSDTALVDGTTIVATPRPFQLSYCNGQHPIFSQGSWYVDLSIDRLNDNGRFANVREEWRLPLRSHLIGSFFKASGARLLRQGMITRPVDINQATVEVRGASDDEIIRSLLTEVPRYDYEDMRRTLQKKPAYRYASPSDKGSYLRGLLGLFGSLSDAEQILGNHFWRSQFLKMAVPAQDQKTEIITYLQRRLRARDGELLINDEAGWQRLAQRIIEKSARLRAPRDKTQYEKLLTAWSAELENAIQLDQDLVPRHDEIMGEATDELKRSLSYLFDRGIFYRGHEWSCRHCSHRNWVSVDGLRNVMACEVCGHNHLLPVDVTLDFRLNDFFATCLREHDTLTVTWALSVLRRESESAFVFGPQMSLYEDYPENQGGRSNRELDVVCIVDNKFVVGEAKLSVALIADSDIEDLADAARKLEADRAVLMVLSGDWAAMNRKVEKLRALLPSHIEVGAFISAWDDAPSACL
jgi:PAS domain-containing protein